MSRNQTYLGSAIPRSGQALNLLVDLMGLVAYAPNGKRPKVLERLLAGERQHPKTAHKAHRQLADLICARAELRWDATEEWREELARCVRAHALSWDVIANGFASGERLWSDERTQVDPFDLLFVEALLAETVAGWVVFCSPEPSERQLELEDALDVPASPEVRKRILDAILKSGPRPVDADQLRKKLRPATVTKLLAAEEYPSPGTLETVAELVGGGDPALARSRYATLLAYRAAWRLCDEVTERVPGIIFEVHARALVFWTKTWLAFWRHVATQIGATNTQWLACRAVFGGVNPLRRDFLLACFHVQGMEGDIGKALGNYALFGDARRDLLRRPAPEYLRGKSIEEQVAIDASAAAQAAMEVFVGWKERSGAGLAKAARAGELAYLIPAVSVLQVEGDGAAARELAQEALARAPDDVRARVAMALVRINAGGWKDALALLEPHLQEESPWAGILDLAGRAYELAGDAERAVELFEKAHAADPEYANAADSASRGLLQLAVERGQARGAGSASRELKMRALKLAREAMHRGMPLAFFEYMASKGGGSESGE